MVENPRQILKKYTGLQQENNIVKVVLLNLQHNK